MAGEWCVVRLGDLVSIKHGWPFKSKLFSEDTTGLPIVVNIGNFRYSGGFRFESTTVKEYRGDYPLEFELTPGDVLVVMTCQTPGGEILGIPGRIPSDGRTYLHNQRLGKVVVKNPDEIDKDFLFWLFHWSEFNRHLFVTASGSKILHTAPARIESFAFNLPSLSEQRAIAHILGTLDDKIEANRRMNETLEALARAIFKSWFVDFDPVRAKSEGRDTGLPKHIADLFPDRFENSELGEIPAGWRVEPIGEATRVVGGGTPSTREPAFWEGGMHYWATPKDLSNLQDPILLDTERKVTDAGLAKISSGLLPAGTVLLSSRAPVGYLAVARVPVSVNQGFIGIKCEGSLTSHYVLHWAISNMEQIEGRASGTTFQEISKKNFRPILALVPADGALAMFEEQVSPLYDKITVNLQQSSTLTSIRNALLPKLISGEIRTTTL